MAGVVGGARLAEDVAFEVTMVSAAMTMAGPTARAATSSALAAARRWTRS